MKKYEFEVGKIYGYEDYQILITKVTKKCVYFRIYKSSEAMNMNRIYRGEKRVEIYRELADKYEKREKYETDEIKLPKCCQSKYRFLYFYARFEVTEN